MAEPFRLLRIAAQARLAAAAAKREARFALTLARRHGPTPLP